MIPSLSNSGKGVRRAAWAHERGLPGAVGAPALVVGVVHGCRHLPRLVRLSR